MADRPSGIQQPIEKPARIGLWGWLGLYTTGAVLFFLAIIHVGEVHWKASGPPGLNRTKAALASPFIMFIEIALLIMALAHGLMGLRRVLLDLELFSPRSDRWLRWVLTAVGLTLVVWGVVIFIFLAKV